MLGARVDLPDPPRRPRPRRGTLDALVWSLWRADRWLIFVVGGGALVEWIR